MATSPVVRPSPVTPPAEPQPALPVADRAVGAFLRDLPQLLVTDPGRWGAYAGERRIGIMDTQTELYRHCLIGLGLTHDQFIVSCIAPGSGEDVELPVR